MLRMLGCLIMFLGVISCNKKEKTLEVFRMPTIDGVECKLYYLNGNLQEIRQTKKEQKTFTLNSYKFYKDGSISTIRRVIGDTMLSTTQFFPSGEIKYIKSDLDLNPNDTLLFNPLQGLLQGTLKAYQGLFL